MATVAVAPKRRGCLRPIITLLVIVGLVGGALFWLSIRAQAGPDASAVLTVFTPGVSVARGTGGTYATVTTGTMVQAGDSVKTDATGRGSIQFPDGSVMRLASSTEITLTSAHFAKDGNLHDATITQKLGRTLSSIQRLVGGATYKVAGQSASASVRGTKFEVLIKPDGSMVVKLFVGDLYFEGKNGTFHLTAGQQATADPQGNVGTRGPIQADPSDPFGAELDASQATSQGTTLGTEQDFVGPPMHNGDQQQYSYSYAGGGLLRAALGYPGSLFTLQVLSPDGATHSNSGPTPVVVTVNPAPPGIFKINVIAVSGIVPAGEVPFLSIAVFEPCVGATIEINNAVRHAYAGKDLAAALPVSGLSNVNIGIQGTSISGAIITGTGSYNGIALGGTVVLYAHGGFVGIVPVAASVFGFNLPADQLATQLASSAGYDLSNINPGFVVDRLFTCSGVLVIDGRTA
jgi:hypothetical protein